ncbi:unnamed protein product [Closterium sp. NIES-54]
MGRLYDMMLLLTEDVDNILEEHAEGISSRGEVGKVGGGGGGAQDRQGPMGWWAGGLACPMHVVGRILDPANQEECIFRNDQECTCVCKAFISTHYDHLTITREDGVERCASLVMQEGLMAFINLQGTFGMPAAIADCQGVKEGNVSVVQWWNWHGSDYPELATLACRVLSQPVPASVFERNWAIWDAVHTTRRNSLGFEKLRDLVYVAHNWEVVHNWHKVPEGLGVVRGNIEEPPIPEGYKMDGEMEDAEVGEDEVLQDE